MVTGTLSNGYEIKVDENKVKTYSFTKLLGMAASKNDAERIYADSKMLPALIGEDGEADLLNYVEKDGHEATQKEITALTIEIVNLMKSQDEEIKK